MPKPKTGLLRVAAGGDWDTALRNTAQECWERGLQQEWARRERARPAEQRLGLGLANGGSWASEEVGGLEQKSAQLPKETAAGKSVCTVSQAPRWHLRCELSARWQINPRGECTTPSLWLIKHRALPGDRDVLISAMFCLERVKGMSRHFGQRHVLAMSAAL